MLSIWWDCSDIIHKEYLEKVKKNVYSETVDHVGATIKEKYETVFRYKKVMFHQDDARPRVSSFTCWTLLRLERDFLHHLLHSPYIAPSGFYLFPHLQLHLASAIFHFAQDVRNEVDLFLAWNLTAQVIMFLGRRLWKTTKILAEVLDWEDD